MNNNFCIMPFVGVEISNSGSVVPCCSFAQRDLHDEQGASYNLNTHSLNEIVTSDSFRNLRQEFIDNKQPAACKKCFDLEAQGIKSQRIRTNNQIGTPSTISKDFFELQIADLKLSNVCNQACVICNPFSSSMIAQENKVILPTHMKRYNEASFHWYKNQEVWNDLFKKATSMKHLDFYGGEPWLIKKHWELIDYLVESGASQDITLNYATNGSLFENHWFDRYFSKFKTVSILMSADGIGKAFEYNRYPGKWEIFENNLNKIIQKKEQGKINWLGISYTLSIYSVFDLINSLNYYNDLNVPVWINPVIEEKFSIRILPDDIKQAILQDIMNSWKCFVLVDKIDWNFFEIELFKQVEDHMSWKYFVDITKAKDNHRKVSIIDIAPSLGNYFK